MNELQLCYGDMQEGLGYIAECPVEVYNGKPLPCIVGTVVVLDKPYVVDTRGHWVEHWEGRILSSENGH